MNDKLIHSQQRLHDSLLELYSQGCVKRDQISDLEASAGAGTEAQFSCLRALETSLRIGIGSARKASVICTNSMTPKRRS